MNRTVERTIVYHNGKYMIKETVTIYWFDFVLYSFDSYKKTAYEVYYGEDKAKKYHRVRSVIKLGFDISNNINEICGLQKENVLINGKQARELNYEGNGTYTYKI